MIAFTTLVGACCFLAARSRGWCFALLCGLLAAAAVPILVYA